MTRSSVQVWHLRQIKCTLLPDRKIELVAVVTGRVLGAAILLFLSTPIVQAQITAPKYSNEFLAIGVGARALAMSNAAVARVDDVSAGYWNPAGLMRMPYKHQFALMHAEYFAGIANYDYAAYATALDSSSRFAVSVIRFGIDDIPDTRFLFDANGNVNYDNIRFFSAADYAFLLSYARKLTILNGLRIGANFKIVHRTAGSFANAWGFGLDAGAQTSYGMWDFGIMARDITGTFNAWTHNSSLLADVYAQTGNLLPQSSLEVTLPRLTAGAARRFEFGEKIGVLTAADLEITFDGMRNAPVRTGLFSVSPAVGLEGSYDQKAFVRFGAGQFQRVLNFDGSKRVSWQPTFGLGMQISSFVVDYAMTDLGNQAEALYSHVFSLMLGLNEKSK